MDESKIISSDISDEGLPNESRNLTVTVFTPSGPGNVTGAKVANGTSGSESIVPSVDIIIVSHPEIGSLQDSVKVAEAEFV